MITREMRAMNTDCLLIVVPERGGAEDDLAGAEATVREYESRFSRFLPTSDLGRLNDNPREEVEVSHELAIVLSRAIHYARLTGGIFDPVVLADLRAIGYDRSFEKVPAASVAARGAAAVRFRWSDVDVDLHRDRVARPVGALIDLGGLAKGAAADAALMVLAGHAAALVDLGGDIRAVGRPDETRNWCIALDDGEGGTRDVVQVVGGAVATSSVRKRRWLNGGAEVHHLIDPRTGQPAVSDAVQCSVLAETTEQAEVAAKVSLIQGPQSLHEDDSIGQQLGVRGVAWITAAGGYLSTPGWRAAGA